MTTRRTVLKIFGVAAALAALAPSKLALAKQIRDWSLTPTPRLVQVGEIGEVLRYDTQRNAWLFEHDVTVWVKGKKHELAVSHLLADGEQCGVSLLKQCREVSLNGMKRWVKRELSREVA